MKNIIFAALITLSISAFSQLQIDNQVYLTTGSMQSVDSHTIGDQSYKGFTMGMNFGIGYQGDLRISDRFDVRLMPLISLVQGNIGGEINNSLTLVQAELPATFKVNIKSFYLHTGFVFSADLIKQFQPSNLKRTSPSNFIFGFGLDMKGADVALNVSGPYQYLDKSGVSTATQFMKVNIAVGIDI